MREVAAVASRVRSRFRNQAPRFLNITRFWFYASAAWLYFFIVKGSRLHTRPKKKNRREQECQFVNKQASQLRCRQWSTPFCFGGLMLQHVFQTWAVFLHCHLMHNDGAFKIFVYCCDGRFSCLDISSWSLTLIPSFNFQWKSVKMRLSTQMKDHDRVFEM